jgi:hypothetical protein
MSKPILPAELWNQIEPPLPSLEPRHYRYAYPGRKLLITAMDWSVCNRSVYWSWVQTWA